MRFMNCLVLNLVFYGMFMECSWGVRLLKTMKHEQAIKICPACRGPARRAILSYVHETSYDSKCNVARHLTGKAHQDAVKGSGFNRDCCTRSRL